MFIEGTLICLWTSNTTNCSANMLKLWGENIAMSVYLERFLSTCLQADLSKYICENQDSISTKLKECCTKPLLEKSHCIAEVDKDELPDGLSPLAADFAEDKEVCKNYHEAKDVFLGT